ncbi:suppressor of fused domain protein [Brevibacillus sp. AY1]|nr:suppressor of fused domain protein [Brevibacillus sp. AY1]
MQLVGITEKELQAIKGKSREERERFVKVMQQDNPDLITDMAREKEYLDF